MANLDGITDLRVVALHELCEPMGTKLRTAVGTGARGTMETIGFAGFIAALVWDSTTPLKISGLPGAGLFPRILKKICGTAPDPNEPEDTRKTLKLDFQNGLAKTTISQEIEA